jgi:hypothetical protein
MLRVEYHERIEPTDGAEGGRRSDITGPG